MLTSRGINEVAGRPTVMGRSAPLKSVPSWITSSNSIIRLTSSQPIVNEVRAQCSQKGCRTLAIGITRTSWLRHVRPKWRHVSAKTPRFLPSRDCLDSGLVGRAPIIPHRRVPAPRPDLDRSGPEVACQRLGAAIRRVLARAIDAACARTDGFPANRAKPRRAGSRSRA
jgi:hypothetical protein